MSNLNLIDYWWVLHLAIIAAVFLLYWIVRGALAFMDHRHSRSMKSYSMRYGACEYFGKSRPNFRRNS